MRGDHFHPQAQRSPQALGVAKPIVRVIKRVFIANMHEQRHLESDEVGIERIEARIRWIDRHGRGDPFDQHSAAFAHRFESLEQAVKEAANTTVRKARLAIENGELEAAREATQVAVVALDKAASKGKIHKNNAARRKFML